MSQFVENPSYSEFSLIDLLVFVSIVYIKWQIS